MQRDGTGDRTVLADLHTKVDDGTPLSTAMADHPSVFSEEEIALVEAGEQTGRLDVTLDQIADLQDRRQRALRQFINKMGYPLLIFHVAALMMPIGLVMAFTGRLDVALAFNIFIVTVIAFWGGVAYLYFGSKDARRRARFRAWLEAVPGLGASFKHQRYALFATVLEASYESGVTLDRGLRLAAQAAGAQGAMTAADRVEAGAPLRDALPGTAVLPVELAARVATAERAGELSVELRRIADEEFEASQLALDRTVAVIGKGFYALMALCVFFYALTILTGIGKAF